MDEFRKMLEELKKAGMKQTPQRIEVVRTLLALKEKHPTLSQVYNEARKNVPTLSFSTLYNTIRKLEDQGMVKLFDLLGETRIEVNKQPHINIINLQTGEIKDYNDEKLLNEVRMKLKLKIDEFILVNILIYEKRE